MGDYEWSITTLLLSYKSYFTNISCPGWYLLTEAAAITPLVLLEKKGNYLAILPTPTLHMDYSH